MSTASDLPTTTFEAERLGWDGLVVRCGCQSTELSWIYLRRNVSESRLFTIASTYRCDQCRRPARTVSLYRQHFTNAFAQPGPTREVVIWGQIDGGGRS